MAYSNKKVEAVENALLQACKTDKIIEERDDSHLTRKKRDKDTIHIANKVKKFSADEAMEISLMNKAEKGEDVEFEVVEGEGSALYAEIQAEREAKRKKNAELAKKMEKYKGKTKTIQHPAFNGLHMNEMQKKFIINLCDPDSPTFGDKHLSYTAAGYTAKNKNSLMANISMNLKKDKIRTAIDRYRKSMISSKRMEISTENVDVLRKRAHYDIRMFYNEDGTMIPYSEIPEEWICCVDDITRDYKGAQANQEIIKYKLCDRQKSIDALNKLLEIQHSISEIPKNQGGRPSNVQAAIDMGKDKDGNQGPRVVINMALFEDD